MGGQGRGCSSIRSISVLIVIGIISVITLIHDWRDVKEWYKFQNNNQNDSSADKQQIPVRQLYHDQANVDNDPPRIKCINWTRKTALNRSVQPIDRWWTENPAWFSHSTNETHACWIEETHQSSIRRKYAHELYVNQHLQDCYRLHYRITWSSGWGADFKTILGALEEGHTIHHVPAVMGWDKANHVPEAWHYAANKEHFIRFPNGTVDYSRLNPTCPEKDLSCYFLPYHNCGPLRHLVNDSQHHLFVGQLNAGLMEEMPLDTKGKYYYEWLSRPLIWFRRAIWDYQQEQGLVARLEANLVGKNENEQNKRSRCSVLHVRRADIILHKRYARKYYAISDYLDKLPNNDDGHQHLVLLTDDANAIDEALEFHPDKTWYFYNRTRHRGSSGGWEQQVPSLDPAKEVITMFAAFGLLEQYCSHLVYGSSGFAEYLWYYMKKKKENDGTPVYRYRVEEDLQKTVDESYKTTESELKERLERSRTMKNQQSKRRFRR